MAYHRASLIDLIDLYLHTKLHSNRRNFLWTDGLTDGQTSRPALLGRLGEVDLIIGHLNKNKSKAVLVVLAAAVVVVVVVVVVVEAAAANNSKW